MKAVIDPAVLRRAMVTVRTIKPTTGDFALKFDGTSLKIWSYDNKFGHFRSCVVSVPFIEGEIRSEDEYYLSMDRVSLFEADLTKMWISLTDKGLHFKYEGSDQSRSASLRRRSDTSKRMKFPSDLQEHGLKSVDPRDFDEMLRQVSCSAQVKDTKTEEDMNVNQIHFYPDGHATSNARYYATITYMQSLELDLSIVSSDIPVIRAICSRVSGDLYVGSDSKNFYMLDLVGRCWLSISLKTSKKPVLSVPAEQATSSFTIDRNTLFNSVKWCALAIDGTQRLTLSVKENAISMLNGTHELSCAPGVLDGKPFSSDLPIKVLNTICEHLSDADVYIKYGGTAVPDIVEFTQSGESVKSRHFVKGMKPR